jgi:thioredoxin-like negative regulator of GroEL
MNKKTVLFLLSIVLLSTFAGTSALLESDKVVISQPGDQWLNLEIQNSLSNNTPVFIYFYSDQCHFCVEQSSIVNELEKEYTGNITVIRLNTDENPLEATEFGVTGVPVMFLTLQLNESTYEYQPFTGLKNYSVLSQSFNTAISMQAEAQTEADPQPAPQPEDNEDAPYALIFTLLALLALAGVIIYLLKQ